MIAHDARDAPMEEKGLSTAEAAERFRIHGPNTVPEPRPHAALVLLRKLSGPVPWMLEASLLLEAGLHRTIEAIIIAGLLLFNAVLSFSQERRAQSAVALLRQRLRVIARIKRDGKWEQRSAEELVPGDLVHVRVGDLVPADLRLVDGELLVDASSLTGESLPVEARRGAPAYAASIVRRGEATGVVTATGARSYFGKTAELVRGAKSESHLESLIAGIVRRLVALDAVLASVVLVDALARRLPLADTIPFVLMLLIASVPVALPATFTLATAIGALELAARGVIVTRLSAIEEAAAMGVLCSDKTGTLTQNRLSLGAVRPYAPFDDSTLLREAAYACDEATQDPLDLAVLRASPAAGAHPDDERIRFVPFDPATKRSEAIVRRGNVDIRVLKGAPNVVGALLNVPIDFAAEVDRLAADGGRVLAVASGPEGKMQLAGLLAFVDPPREDSKALIESLRSLGVRVILVTGDGAGTARAVARSLTIGERVGGGEAAAREPLAFDVVAGVLPEDKLHVVKALQRTGAVVGMTGDGVNDAPALKQAEVGIAVASATDVAKAAASVVLTQPGLQGVLAAVETGRRIYQRMLTYTINKIVKTIEVAFFLSIGFVVTGQLVTTPRLILLLLFTNDFVTMSLAGDRVTGSREPDRWNVGHLVATAVALAASWLVFSLGALFVARQLLGLPLASVQTLAFLVLVFGGQANVYLVRERRRFWRSVPSPWMLLATALDLALVTVFATRGILMAPLPLRIVAALLAATVAFMVVLDVAKVRAFART